MVALRLGAKTTNRAQSRLYRVYLFGGGAVRRPNTIKKGWTLLESVQPDAISNDPKRAATIGRDSQSSRTGG